MHGISSSSRIVSFLGPFIFITSLHENNLIKMLKVLQFVFVKYHKINHVRFYDTNKIVSQDVCACSYVPFHDCCIHIYVYIYVRMYEYRNLWMNE